MDLRILRALKLKRGLKGKVKHFIYKIGLLEFDSASLGDFRKNTKIIRSYLWLNYKGLINLLEYCAGVVPIKKVKKWTNMLEKLERQNIRAFKRVNDE